MTATRRGMGHGLDIGGAGNEQSFRRLVEPHLAMLHGHCYRMLGSMHDADDAIQDTLLRAWRALPEFQGRSSVRSWLYRIATNTCLTMIERRPRRVLRLESSHPADPRERPEEASMESMWLEPFADELQGASTEARYEQRESLELAFVAALQHLPPRQRSVLILRDVLGFSGAEVAEMLDTAPSSVYSLLQRAHRAVDNRIPEVSQQQTLRMLGDERVQALAGRYVGAWEDGDPDALVALLTEDARMTMPPRPTWYRGRAAVGEFVKRTPMAPGRRWRLVPTRANAQVAFGVYGWDRSRGVFVAHGVHVLTLSPAGRIGDIAAFLEPALNARFGLPTELPSDGAAPRGASSSAER